MQPLGERSVGPVPCSMFRPLPARSPGTRPALPDAASRPSGGCSSSSKRVEAEFIEPWRSAVQLEWRVGCVRIPRFPIGAVWRAARRGDLGASDVQLLLPFQREVRREAGSGEGEVGGWERKASSLTMEGSRTGSFLASAAAPSRSTASAVVTPFAVRPPQRAPAEPAVEWDERPIVLTEVAGSTSTAGRRRLRAVSAAAGRAGIRAGMTIAEARAMCGELLEYPWDDVAIAGATTEMTAMLLAASPQVTPVAGTPGMWWVGASGFASAGAWGMGGGGGGGWRAP